MSLRQRLARVLIWFWIFSWTAVSIVGTIFGSWFFCIQLNIYKGGDSSWLSVPLSVLGLVSFENTYMDVISLVSPIIRQLYFFEIVLLFSKHFLLLFSFFEYQLYGFWIPTNSLLLDCIVMPSCNFEMNQESCPMRLIIENSWLMLNQELDKLYHQWCGNELYNDLSILCHINNIMNWIQSS